MFFTIKMVLIAVWLSYNYNSGDVFDAIHNLLQRRLNIIQAHVKHSFKIYYIKKILNH